MRSEGQIRHKLQQVTYRHLQRAIRTALSRRPGNCAHNRLVGLPRGELRFCQLHEDEDGVYPSCDEAFNGIDWCSRCSDFKRVATKESVREAFTIFLKSSDVATIAVQYPDIAALLWALDAEGPVAASEMDAGAQEQETVPTRTISGSLESLLPDLPPES